MIFQTLHLRAANGIFETCWSAIFPNVTEQHGTQPPHPKKRRGGGELMITHAIVRRPSTSHPYNAETEQRNSAGLSPTRPRFTRVICTSCCYGHHPCVATPNQILPWIYWPSREIKRYTFGRCECTPSTKRDFDRGRGGGSNSWL